MCKLEDIINACEGLHQLSESQKGAVQLVMDWLNKKQYLDNALPSKKIGTRLFEEIKKKVAQLTREEAEMIFELAYTRIEAHTQKGQYRADYKELDNALHELPTIIADIKAEHPQNTELVPKFLRYCKALKKDTELKAYLTEFSTFAKAKEFYDAVPDKYKALPGICHQLHYDNWDNVRKYFENPPDNTAISLAEKFKALEKALGVVYSELIRFFEKPIT